MRNSWKPLKRTSNSRLNFLKVYNRVYFSLPLIAEYVIYMYTGSYSLRDILFAFVVRSSLAAQHPFFMSPHNVNYHVYGPWRAVAGEYL